MIYKFQEPIEQGGAILEFTIVTAKDKVSFITTEFDEDSKPITNVILLSKDDIFKMIGALHLLHKEMK
jgi:hypothetical protein